MIRNGFENRFGNKLQDGRLYFYNFVAIPEAFCRSLVWYLFDNSILDEMKINSFLLHRYHRRFLIFIRREYAVFIRAKKRSVG